MISVEEYHLGPQAEGVDTALKAAWKDFWGGLALYSIWSMLAWQDIRQRYRRSVIGPFWLTISSAIMIGSLGILYSALFHQVIKSYLPFLAIGIIIWGFISTVLNEACNVFISVEGMMKQLRLPLTVHVCRMVWRNLIIFFHSFVVLLVVIIWADISINFEFFILPLVLILYCLNALFVGLILGIVCTRFRDVGPLVANFVQLLFFVTPIMWGPEILTARNADMTWVAYFNPAYHYIEIFRTPLLGKPFPQASWLIVAMTTFVGWGITIWMLKKYRHRVAYWL